LEKFPALHFYRRPWDLEKFRALPFIEALGLGKIPYSPPLEKDLGLGKILSSPFCRGSKVWKNSELSSL